MLATMFLTQMHTAKKLPGSRGSSLLTDLSRKASTTLCVLALLLLSFASRAQVLNLTYNPSVVCEGNNAILTITPPVGLPSGVTVLDYIYYYNDPANPNPQDSAITNNLQVPYIYPPGVYFPKVVARLSDGSTLASNVPTLTVYHKPIAGFTPITNLIQCFKDNKSCFQNTSQQAAAPSTPIVQCVWEYGDAFSDSVTDLNNICHEYPFPGTFTVTLRVLDSLGCRNEIFLPPATPIVIKVPIKPDFKWARRTGPCVVSNFLFTNTSSIDPGTVQKYTWYFGDGSTYSATAPFSPADLALFDTIPHDYTTNGEFSPALTITDTTGCTDSTLMTNQNSPIPIPKNIIFQIDITTIKSETEFDPRDSVCIGSFNSGSIFFKQTPIQFLSPADILWEFDDPPTLQLNFDNTSWTPGHAFSGMKTYFPMLHILNVCPATYNYYSAITLKDDIFLDKYIYANNDLFDANSQPRLVTDTIRSTYTSPGIKKLSYLHTYTVTEYGKDTIYSYKGPLDKPIYYINNDTIVYDENGAVRDTVLLPPDGSFVVLKTAPAKNDTFVIYKYYGYGVRNIGPQSKIEDPPNGIVVKSQLKSQCGPSDTVDFVNASKSYKSRMVWRRWDFDDNFAPQCTSFSIPKAGFPPIVGIQFLDSVTFDNGLTYVKYGADTIHNISYNLDTIRQWKDAPQQYENSDHYFIANGQVYGGKMWCKFSYDSLPRHLYPNWDTIYRWYSTGKDFMPWDPGTYGPSGSIPVHPADTMFWNKPVYLDPVTGNWSLTQGSGPAPYGLWARIDTMNLKINNGQDLRQGEPITLNKVPDPFHTINNSPNYKGDYNVISGGQIRPTTAISYRDRYTGATYTIHGSDTLPGSDKMIFYKYAFTRIITRCITVKLRLKDSMNNETTKGVPLDSNMLDTGDCFMEATLQLQLAKADAHGLSKGGKECPGFLPNGPTFEMGALGPFPGVIPSCGQTFILFNFDSLADRFDNTPCVLDGFVTYTGDMATPTPGVSSTTPGGLVIPPFFTSGNFNNPNTLWQSPGSTKIYWHYGMNAPANRPPPADTALGWVTVGMTIGSGIKDTLITGIPYANYLAQLSYYGNDTLPPPGIKAQIDLPVQYGATSSAIPGAPASYDYQFSKVKNFRTVPLGPSFVDLVDIEYVDAKWPKCMADTVWYHNFLKINNLTAKFFVDPVNCRLRHKGEDVTVYYEDSIQDDIQYSAWVWGDNTLTVDSFFYAPDSLPDLTDGYFVNGVRRVRYNFDLQSGGYDLLDSTVWPIRASGIGATDGVVAGTLTSSVAYNLYDKCTGGVNPHPTYALADTALMFLPITHKFVRTSWEATYKTDLSRPGDMLHLIGSTRGCVQSFPIQMTIGILDTFDIKNGKGISDTTFCENEDVYFIDSLRYWRFDCQLTDLPNVPAVSVSPAYVGSLGDFPWDALQIDSADFWRQDVGDPRPIQNISFTPGYAGKIQIDTVVAERVYWDYGDGSAIDSSMRPIHKYAHFGRYMITMVSKDSLGGYDTCYGFVNISRPVAKIGFTKDASGIPRDIFNCGDFADFIDSSSMDPSTLAGALDSIKTNWWWFGENKVDTVTFNSLNNPFPKWPYRTNGLFRVKLVVETFQGCTDTTWDTVFIRGPRPEFQLVNAGDTIGCAPFKVRILNLADSTGKYLTPNGTTLASDTPTLTTYFDWGDGVSPQTIVTGRRDTVEFTYANPGEYYIYGYGSDAVPGGQNSCALQVFPDTLLRPKIKITVLDLKREILLDKDVICKDRSVKITNNSDTLYTTYDYIIYNDSAAVVDSLNKPSPSSFNESFTDTGTYMIIARPSTLNPIIPLNVQNNCKANDTLSLKVVTPVPSFTIDTMQTPVFHMTNTSDTTINSTYVWLVRKVGTTTPIMNTPYNGNNQNPDFNFDLQNDTGTFEICLTSTAKGIDPIEACEDSTCQTVKVTFTINLEIPNVFSPNDDGTNDQFKIKIEGEQKYKLTIYNRWGAKVFESGDAKTMWNGKNNNDGAECPAGVYYYIFDYQLRTETSKTRTGTVTLIR